MSGTAATVLIAAGGTGGHVVPALHVAHELRERGASVVWLGTRAGIEARLVPAADIPIEWLSVSGLRGKGWRSWAAAPFKLLLAGWQAARALWRHRPGVVLGMGGFVAGPGGALARLSGRRLVLHEQNAVAGTTNRLLARWADVVLTAVPTEFAGARDVRCVGNPVASELADIPEPAARLRRGDGVLRVLVIGGSQGARVFNEVLPVAVRSLDNIQLWHQCGERDVAATQSAYRANGTRAEVCAFIDDMPAAYRWADLVVSRAGAMSVAELAASGSASVLIPYPFATDDHQSANSAAMVRAGAAVLLPQARLDAEGLSALLAELAADRERLIDMATAARALARPDAAEQVARLLLELSS